MVGSPRRVSVYVALLATLSALVFLDFVRPTVGRHAGINAYGRAKFLDMVEGRAWRPFVYRVLLPTSVRVAASVAPPTVRQACTDMVEGHRMLGRAFDVCGWETKAAFEYTFASLLMLLCFLGFGHFAAVFTEQALSLSPRISTRSLLAAAALLGVPPFFRYTSFPYDPPQLFLFTLGLSFLAARRSTPFIAVFVLLCLNKETAVLLIPVYALVFAKGGLPRRQYWTTLAGLAVVYAAITVAIRLAFVDNPGSPFERHLGHNLKLLSDGWTFVDLFVGMGLAGLVFARWMDKPALLRDSLLLVLLPLVALTFWLGFMDEWRDYYEAYPIIFALATHTVMGLMDALGCGCRDGKRP